MPTLKIALILVLILSCNKLFINNGFACNFIEYIYITEPGQRVVPNFSEVSRPSSQDAICLFPNILLK